MISALFYLKAMSNAYTSFSNNFIRDPTLSYKAKLVYFVLKSYQDFRDLTEPVFLGIVKLSEKTQLSQTVVKQGLKELENKGYIRREQRHQKSTLTFILK